MKKLRFSKVYSTYVPVNYTAKIVWDVPGLPKTPSRITVQSGYLMEQDNSFPAFMIQDTPDFMGVVNGTLLWNSAQGPQNTFYNFNSTFCVANVDPQSMYDIWYPLATFSWLTVGNYVGRTFNPTWSNRPGVPFDVWTTSSELLPGLGLTLSTLDEGQLRAGRLGMTSYPRGFLAGYSWWFSAVSNLGVIPQNTFNVPSMCKSAKSQIFRTFERKFIQNL